MQKETVGKVTTPPARMLVLMGKNSACVKITGRANFTFGPDFKTLVSELNQKGYGHFVVDLSGCVLMDSTFLGVLAGFGLKMGQANAADKKGIELLNPNPRIMELLENLGMLPLFKITTGALRLSDGVQTRMPDSLHPTLEQIARTSLEAHQTLMTVSPDNAARFKDVARFLAEDLKNLENRP